MAARKPSLLQLSPEEILGRALALGSSLSLAQGAAVRLLLSQPALLDTPPDAFKTVVLRVAAALDMTQGSAAVMLSRLAADPLRQVRGSIGDVILFLRFNGKDMALPCPRQGHGCK